MLTNSKAIKINLITIIAVYLLILVGGIVRSVGAGMGCPDWPKCFGSYIPPVSDDNLPAGYEEVYVEKRIAKNVRLSGVLKSLGFIELSDQVVSDQSVYETTYFDVTKAWVEYINRLIGVVIGILIIANMWWSLKYWKDQKSVTILGITSFILVLFQGWIGSLVVSTNLIPGFISFHMLLALILVGLLLVQRFLMKGSNKSYYEGKWLSILILTLFTIQIFFGIGVREQIDIIGHTTNLLRSLWIENVGGVFHIHRTYSILLLVLVGWLGFINWKAGTFGFEFKGLILVILLEVVVGAVLSYFALPPFLQPVHLLLASVAYGLIFYIFLSVGFKRQNS